MVRLKITMNVRGGLTGGRLDEAIRAGLQEGLRSVHAASLPGSALGVCKGRED